MRSEGHPGPEVLPEPHLMGAFHCILTTVQGSGQSGPGSESKTVANTKMALQSEVGAFRVTGSLSLLISLRFSQHLTDDETETSSWNLNQPDSGARSCAVPWQSSACTGLESQAFMSFNRLFIPLVNICWMPTKCQALCWTLRGTVYKHWHNFCSRGSYSLVRERDFSNNK